VAAAINCGDQLRRTAAAPRFDGRSGSCMERCPSLASEDGRRRNVAKTDPFRSAAGYYTIDLLA